IPCAMDGGRPVVGALNIAQASALFVRLYSRLAAHEIAHTLGFNYDVMVSRGMVANITGVRSKPQVTVVNSSRTVEKARAHYGCDKLPGMELEDEGGEVYELSHWKRRNAKDELMAAPLGLSAHLYTALTMAAFEDMGFFRANWGMEEPMGWGSNAGCDLLQEKCLTNGTTKYPGMFCSERIVKCTSDRTGLGECSLYEYDSALPEWFQYFSNLNIGAYPLSLTDYCPVVEYRYQVCAETDPPAQEGNIISSDSWCLDGNELTVNTPLGASQTGGVCA
ncbi:surface protease GP63, partial [Trypanosoma grayi]|uniref:surface protease GP63 n=1 Tax=Trypanosoma grayi TaxID=71804 RepID=UPI0004F4733B